MKINTQKFTDRSENTYEIHEATTNLGLTVTLSPLGASIQKIAIRTDQGEDLSMALSLPDPTVRPADAGYAGATLGPNAGRIRGSELPIGNRMRAAISSMAAPTTFPQSYGPQTPSHAPMIM